MTTPATPIPARALESLIRQQAIGAWEYDGWRFTSRDLAAYALALVTEARDTVCMLGEIIEDSRWVLAHAKATNDEALVAHLGGEVKMVRAHYDAIRALLPADEED